MNSIFIAFMPTFCGAFTIACPYCGKAEFVRALSATFLVFKVTQLGAVWQVGLIDRRLLWPSLAAIVVSLVGFGVGLAVQDRVPQGTFNRAVLLLLTVVAVAMLFRALRA